MTDNEFDFFSDDFLGSRVFAFDRAKMLVGDPTASFIYFDLADVDPQIGGMLPSDMDGLTPPPRGHRTILPTSRRTNSGTRRMH